MIYMSVKIQIRRGTAAEWISANPILLNGEQGLETDTKRTKIGNGTSAWNSLPYEYIGATGSGTNQIFYDNDIVITQNYNLSPNKNAMSSGPLTIGNNVIVTIPIGQSWSIV